MSAVAPSELSLRELSRLDGVPIGTLRTWREDYDDFPSPTRRVGNTDLFPLGEYRHFRRRHPTLGLGRGGHKRKAE
jgi:hypothetical protein